MDTTSPSAPPAGPPAGRGARGLRSWSLRQRRSLAATVVLAVIASVGLAVSPGAGAEPKFCEDGNPPPCPEPSPTSTRPRTGPAWSANVNIADLSNGLGFRRDEHAEWARAGSPHYITNPEPVVWSDGAQTHGTVTMVDPEHGLPAGNVRGFYLAEQGFSGPLCRSQPYSAVPQSGRTADIIVAPKVTTTQADLNRVASDLIGDLAGVPDDADVQITNAEIQIVGTSLQVRIRGHLDYDVQFPLPNVGASFDYITTVSLTESRSTDNVNELIAVTTAPGTLELTGDGITDSIELAIYGDVEPVFRRATQSAANSAIVGLVNANPLVAQFRAQGFVLSARKVVVGATTGIEVWPSLCHFA